MRPLPWVLERSEPGKIAPRYLGVFNGRLAWITHNCLALRFADNLSAGRMLKALSVPPFDGGHLNGTERAAEFAA